MKLGLTGLQAGQGADGPRVIELARTIEELGFESVWTTEHVVMPETYDSRYPYNETGRLANAGEVERPAALVWLAYAAAASTRLRLGTGVLLLGLRNPVLFAKESATLDRLSGGRLLLGVGLGWMREEFAAVDVPWQDRAARVEEYIAVLRTLWGPGPASFSGDFINFQPVRSSPHPVQPGGIPILIAGHSEAAARRAGRIGDGYFPLGRREADLVNLIALMREEAEGAGRDPARIEITTQGPWDADLIARMESIGVDRHVIFNTDPGVANDPRKLEKLSTGVRSWLTV
jgi:probable F420-dependent oxidoreductase